MSNYHPILSICIPTYNRSDVLKRCIESIIKNNGFCEDVEIVISDNCSTDDTECISRDYASRFTNISYFKNPTNVGGERNFILALQRGNGQFLKLMNDYSSFTETGLINILRSIKENIHEKRPLFYQNNNDGLFREICSLDRLIQLEGWGMSWIGSYGYWKDDFNALENIDSKIESQFLQIDWFLRIYEKKNSCVLYRFHQTFRHQFNSKQGGYNFFKVHLSNFLSMYQPYLKRKIISKITYINLKRHMLDQMLEWHKKLCINKEPQFSYDTKGVYFIFFKTYWTYPWFYFRTCRYILHLIKENIIRIDK